MTSDLCWSCKCGMLRMNVVPDGGTRIMCYCRDCRAFARLLKAEHTLDSAGGSDLFQTVPDRITVVQGAASLASLRLTAKGPIRWYSNCCGTPLANTMPTSQLPFASITVAGFENRDALGPVTARVNLKGATARVDDAKGHIGPLLLKILGRTITARLTGRHRKTPFFDDAGDPVSPPRTITAEERARGYSAV